MKNWTLGKPYGIKPRCCWEHLGELIWEHFGNLRTLWEHDEKMLGRHWEQGGKIQNPSPLTPSKRKRQGPSWVQAEPSHWLPESFISKTVCHHFWAGLMAGAEIWWHSVVDWINARVPTSPVAYLRILEPDWKDKRTLLKTTLTPKIWKLQTLPFMKDTKKRCAFVLKSWFEVKNVWTLDVTGKGFRVDPPLNLLFNLSIYEVRYLVCFVVIISTELGCFRLWSWCLREAVDDVGCMGLIRWHLDLRCKSSPILNDFFTEYRIKP